ncbi:hypothetical protein MUN76_07320 [Leucobacter rhizosphaerae]|uniref:DUF4287 domain-containing protein n=1 Tax=Leucobacter rhizosphaerae TaxID=2932245 RepID=A0ABY4FZU8_9MICO|nr:hypothetical protein [Leucobacter rhizosphaerae]UOQ61756.1 hypothetical protein MUN76_07320 [Leucobacter rhizosphaerae]
MSDAAQSETNKTRAESIPGIERATGRSWAEWVEIFESQGARTLPHPKIAIVARAAVPETLANPDWWAQGIAIAYEQHAGLRVPGQSSTGTFRVSASRTLSADRDAIIDAWAALAETRTEHLGHAPGEPRRSRTDKRTFWRLDLDGAGRVEVAASPKTDDKVIVAVSQDGLPDGNRIEEWRAHWKALLAEL